MGACRFENFPVHTAKLRRQSRRCRICSWSRTRIASDQAIGLPTLARTNCDFPGLQNWPGPGTTKELAESVRRPGIALTGSLDSTDSAPVQEDAQIWPHGVIRAAGVIVDDQRKREDLFAPTVLMISRLLQCHYPGRPAPRRAKGTCGSRVKSGTWNGRVGLVEHSVSAFKLKI